MRHAPIAFQLVGPLVLSAAVPGVGSVTTLTPYDMGITQNPGMPNDSLFRLRFEASIGGGSSAREMVR